MRIADNPALDVAIEAGNLLELPVLVYFSVIPNYPMPILRHYAFSSKGCGNVAADAAERGVGFAVRRPPGNSLEVFLEEVQAALLIGDENPCREPERWRRVLSRRLRHAILDSRTPMVLCRRGSSTATLCCCNHFRPYLHRELTKYLIAPENITPLHTWKPRKALPQFFNFRMTFTEGFSKLDRTVKPVTVSPGARTPRSNG